MLISDCMWRSLEATTVCPAQSLLPFSLHTLRHLVLAGVIDSLKPFLSPSMAGSILTSFLSNATARFV